MKVFAILSLLAVGAVAAALPEAEAGAAPEAFILEKRAPNCNKIVPVCASGTFIQKAGCQCPGQKPACDLWACPGGKRQVCGQQGSGCVFV